jgi:hypothetical protein
MVTVINLTAGDMPIKRTYSSKEGRSGDLFS